MTAPADSSILTKVLSIDHTLFILSFIFFVLLLIIAIMGICSESVWKWRFFLLFTKVYFKINIILINLNIKNVIWIQFSLGWKLLHNFCMIYNFIIAIHFSICKMQSNNLNPDNAIWPALLVERTFELLEISSRLNIIFQSCSKEIIQMIGELITEVLMRQIKC